ncbi:MAG: TonB-dependent receptor [Bacteroidia bacterium]|nr:TonB-dependent receptor [Bacteroidia bacterium]
MKNSITVLVALICLLTTHVSAQQLTQKIRGSVFDQDSRTPLPEAYVQVLNTNPEISAITDSDGNFSLSDVPVGRVTIKVSYIGYEDKTMPNVLVGSGKEVILNVGITESVANLKQTVITKKKNRQKVLNEMAVVSARSFSVEQTKRYAGAIDDPARMVSAFAGVNGNAEGNNDIVVRGNSPRGILWRLDGIEIPNPNHFAAEGGTGGPINALNSSMLGNSDFFTGAFSADYGNALSGVFDMKLRSGNNEKREYSATASILGTDLTAEGPFGKGYNGSYLVNYRYSTLAMLDDIGVVDFGGVPKYQDGSFKVKLPAGKKHTVSMFGLGGISSISQQITSEEDENLVLSEGEAGSKLGVLGLTHTYLIGDKAFLKTTLSTTATELENTYSIPDDGQRLYEVARSSFLKTNLGANAVLNYKFNARNKLKTGIIVNRLSYDLNDQYWSFITDKLEPTLEKDGQATTIQAYTSWKNRITTDLTLVTGVHYMHFLLNDRKSLEPRLALNWQQSPGQSFSAGFGIHSKTESIATYLGQQQQDDGSFINPNNNLGFSKAAHFVVGYDKRLNRVTQLKLEAYYQKLFNVPIEDEANSTYSLLNSSDWFTTRSLVNNGEGRNYGLEATVERSFSNNFYYMSTLSLYRSLYTAADNVERSTAFDGNYVFNLLGGKEFKLGKPEKKRTLFVNTKIALIGGSRYTPINLAESVSLGDVVRDELNPFSAKGDDVFIAELAIGLRRDRKKTTTELKLDIKNVTNNKAVVNEYYNHATESIEVSHQLPLLPVLSYKVSF